MSMTEPTAETSGLGGLVRGLFDFKFERFISRQAITIIYVLGMSVIALGTFVFWIMTIIGSVSADQNLMALVMFFLVPAVGVLYLIGLRMMLESQVVRFRQYDSVKQIEGGIVGDNDRPSAPGISYPPGSGPTAPSGPPPGPPPTPPIA